MVQKQTTQKQAAKNHAAQKQAALEWDDLRVALAVARDGSVRGAARSLGVSHSTVLRRLANLEGEVGVRLFERKHEGYEVTSAGQDVFETARDVEDAVIALERRVQGRDLRLAGPVRVTLPDPVLPALLPMCKKVTARYPEIDLTLAVGVGFADLAHREADIALRIGNEPPAELIGRRVANVTCGIYGSKQYLASRSLKDLQALDWVGWETHSSMAFAVWMREHVPKARIGLRLNGSWAIPDAVEAGLGVALLPCVTGDLRPNWRRVRLLPEITAPLWILTHRDLRTTARVRVLREFLAEAIQEQRGLFEGTERCA